MIIARPDIAATVEAALTRAPPVALLGPRQVGKTTLVNLAEWRGHGLERLRQQVSLTGDHGLAALHAALQRLPGSEAAAAPDFASTLGGVAVSLRTARQQGCCR
ncbi:MAG: hypothetical protein NTZ14_19440 [Hyphomicrobiales bacterium]|nr:hypothetical protein [Hyphomicrobiales bacterium]